MSENARPRNGRALVLVFLIVAAALAAVITAWTVHGRPDNLVTLTILSVLGLLSWRLRERDIGSRVAFSFTSVIQLASAALVGPTGAAIVGAVSFAPELGRRPLRVASFNMAMSSLIGTAGGVTYLLVGGPSALPSLHGVDTILVQVGIPLMVADVVQCLTNALLLGGVIAVSGGVAFRPTVLGLLANSGPAYVGYGLIGFLFVVLWEPAEVGPFSALLVLAPLFVARWSFVQYGEEVRSHESTVRALVTAMQTRNREVADRADRVADLAVELGTELGMGPVALQQLRYAALLRDVGMLGLPAEVCLKPLVELAPAQRLELEKGRRRGADLVAGIDFLRSASPLIRVQPLRGSSTELSRVPMPVKVIAAADAIDALTHPLVGSRAVEGCTRSAAMSTVMSQSRFAEDVELAEALQRCIDYAEAPR